MSAKTVSVKILRSPDTYQIRVGSGQLEGAGKWLTRCTGKNVRRVAIISNATVFGIYGECVLSGLEENGLAPAVHLIGDGERYKNLRTLEKALQFLGENRFTRTDAVLALGGGVVGDLAGLAASVYLRGIAFLQAPTTLLSMIDSSVGGKTGANSPFGKNLIGSFYQPSGVLIDVGTLKTLPPRELTAGFCEAVKQAALSGTELFHSTTSFLSGFPLSGRREKLEDRRTLATMVDLIASQIAFKARIVQGDEREDALKAGATSRKILNLGHTLAHALEKVTNYKKFKHGEAVGHGIAFAAALSNRLEFLDKDEVKLLNDVVRSAGPLPSLAGIEPRDIVEAITYDKKVVNDTLQWVLLKKIGKPVIVSNDAIPKPVLIETIREFLQK